MERFSNINFHFDGSKGNASYPQTIITTYFGKSTRWIQDEAIEYIKPSSPQPKADALIHTFRTGDICKFHNEGEPSFCHAGNTGPRMTLLIR